MKWKRDNLKSVLAGLNWPLWIAVAVLIAMAVWNLGAHLITAAGVGLGVWIIAGSLWVLVKRVKSWRDLRNTPRAYFGLVLGHMGMGLVLLAITVVTTWQQENILSMKVGDQTSIGPYQVRLAKVETVPGPNYQAERGTFELSSGGSVFRILDAERRMYPLQQMQTNQTGIRTNLISNTYIALGDADTKGGWTVRMYWHPMAPFLWIGGFIMALGGFVSLSDRRFRVGVVQKARVAIPLGATA